MITGPMCFSILRVPKFGVPTLANLWRENFHPLTRNYGHSSWYDQLGFRIYNLESRKCMTTIAGRKAKANPRSKPTNIRNEILEESVSASFTVSIRDIETTGFSRNLDRIVEIALQDLSGGENSTFKALINSKRDILNSSVHVRRPDVPRMKELIQTQKLQYCDIQQTIIKNKELARLVTVMTFDTETTGFRRKANFLRKPDRIVEFAFQNLSGGENSTIETLINPECDILNSSVHGIEDHMVRRPDVPRMEEFIPILLQFVKSCQKPDGFILFVAHNARTFDVPFLLQEFSRCSIDIPPNWLFLDTIPLARQLMKSSDSKLTKTSLEALGKYYGISVEGSAHRAMSDVRLLSLILQRLTFDLKLGIPDLIERSFTALDLINKKKN